MRKPGAALLAAAAILIAGAPASAQDPLAARASATAVYGLYTGDDDSYVGPDWEMPVYSAETSALIAQWEELLPDGEVDDLNSAGWFCECQDWGPDFTVMLEPSNFEDGKPVYTVYVDSGWGDQSIQTLSMVHEGNRWLVDDLVTQSMPDGLKAELRKWIAHWDGSAPQW